MNKPFFITTPIYYANGRPHIGHAYTTVAADTIARFKKLDGEEVFFSTGTDEHGLKIQERAEEEGKEALAFATEMSDGFRALWEALRIEPTAFIRTTAPAHIEAVRKVLQTLYEKGAIYQGFYEGLYCIGCEQFKTPDDLIDGRCPDHDRVPELLKEDAYLLKMTELQAELIQRIESDELRIAPQKYKTEMLSFLRGETLEDISISRKNVRWGIPLPFDETQTTYVWADAFLNYLTVLGWDGDPGNIPAQWPADVHLIGKDILRVHATIWPVLLIHLGLPTPKLIFTHGHILSGGKKMGKSLGNSIDIDLALEKFGADGVRYLLMSAGTFGEDVDLTLERMTEKYNADLANGLGNLVSRVVKLSEQLDVLPAYRKFIREEGEGPLSRSDHALSEYKFAEALGDIWTQVRKANQYIDEIKPWELAKENREEFSKAMQYLFDTLSSIGFSLQPFLPDTSEKISKALERGSVEPLFRRIES